MRISKTQKAGKRLVENSTGRFECIKQIQKIIVDSVDETPFCFTSCLRCLARLW